LVPAGDPTEDVDHHTAHTRVREDDLERGLHDRFLRAATDVEEVRGAAAGIADRVERRHHQPRAVPDDPDVAIELDEAEAESPCARASNASRPSSGLGHPRAILFGDATATSSISMPPTVESITTGRRRSRSRVIPT